MDAAGQPSDILRCGSVRFRNSKYNPDYQGPVFVVGENTTLGNDFNAVLALGLGIQDMAVGSSNSDSVKRAVDAD